MVWEASRQTGDTGRSINGTGTQLVLNDIYTSDGGDFDGDGIDNNSFGIRTELAVDIYRTRVLKKADGAHSLDVVGNRSDEKIMDASAATGYRYVSNPLTQDAENRPLDLR